VWVIGVRASGLVTMGWPGSIEPALPGKIPYGMGDCEPIPVWASSVGGAAVTKTSAHTTKHRPRFDVINFMPSPLISRFKSTSSKELSMVEVPTTTLS